MRCQTPDISQNVVRSCEVFFHGESYVAGDLDTHDWICSALAQLSNAMVLSVGYRQPPEVSRLDWMTAFPAVHLDLYRFTFKWNEYIGLRTSKKLKILHWILLGGNYAYVSQAFIRLCCPCLTFKSRDLWQGTKAETEDRERERDRETCWYTSCLLYRTCAYIILVCLISWPNTSGPLSFRCIFRKLQCQLLQHYNWLQIMREREREI